MTGTRSVRAFLEPHHLELATRVEEIVRRRFLHLAPPADDAAARAAARGLVEAMGEEKLLSGTISSATDLRSLCLIREALAGASPLADALFALQVLGSMPIALVGSAEQQERWLPGVATGRAIAGFAMTEPEAGSDVGGIATTARRDGPDYVLDGLKSFISNAGIADFYCVFASMNRTMGTRGLACFVVPAKSPGLRFVAPFVLSEPHPLGEIAFESCRIPASSRLGEEGEGFKLGMRTLDLLRPTVAAAACGMAARALGEAVAHARSRRQFGSVLADFQLIQAKIARMATDLAAARLLTYRAAWEQDRGALRVTKESAMAKLFATEAAQRIVDDAVQILGGRGVLAHSMVDRLYRAVRGLRIYEGTSEIQQLVIAREILRQDN
ncbi:MAG: Acyl-CoA dehydrogenase [Acidobacteriota bacterium]|nr:Acyl-CoA dehydrogenase [Acidobacteriota bacterium]